MPLGYYLKSFVELNYIIGRSSFLMVLIQICSLIDDSGKYSIITFEDYIAIALNAPRVVGIYPEIKNPVFINQRVSFLIQK